MIWTAIYGVLLSIALGLAWRSGSVLYLKMALYMLASWALYNTVVPLFGFPHGLLIDALGDALIATGVGAIGLRARSWTALWVVAFFVAEECWHLAASVAGRENDYWYHAALNVIFALQVVIIGGAAVATMARHRAPAAHWRFSPVRLGR